MGDLTELPVWSFFFFNDTATTEIYTLSLHDALPIFSGAVGLPAPDSTKVAVNYPAGYRSEEHTSELQSHSDLVCRLLLEKKKNENAGRPKNDEIGGARGKIPVLRRDRHDAGRRDVPPGRQLFFFLMIRRPPRSPLFPTRRSSDLGPRRVPVKPRMTQKNTGVRKTPKSVTRSEEHTSELQSHSELVCRLLLEKK